MFRFSMLYVGSYSLIVPELDHQTCDTSILQTEFMVASAIFKGDVARGKSLIVFRSAAD
jgi:hypothetical protein